MYTNVIMAGFGGQGVMLIGNLLAYAGMEEGRHVTFIPVYGPEMRGGTANCTVVISDDDIGSPIINRPQGLIIMNHPSLDKFAPMLKAGGTLVYNRSLVPEADVAAMNTPKRQLTTVGVAAGDVAAALGSVKMANMVALGAYVAATGAVRLETVERCLPCVVAAHYAALVPKNAACLKAGYEAVKAAQTEAAQTEANEAAKEGAGA